MNDFKGVKYDVINAFDSEILGERLSGNGEEVGWNEVEVFGV